MRKNLLLSLFASGVMAAILGSSFQTKSNDTGAPSGNTGSPFDNHTCARTGCHPGSATTIAGIITSDVPVTGYVHGTTYTITATVTDPNLIKFGFEISPQSTAGTLLGTLAISDALHTKFTGIGNKYITHTLSGTSASNHTATWSFNWTAPAAGTGDVTFYGAFNYSNNNGSTSGDVIHTSTLTIPEAIPNGVDEVPGISELNVYPNPVIKEIGIIYYLAQSQPVNISLFDLTGKKIASFINEDQAAGSYNRTFPINTTLAPGIYILRLQAGNQSYAKKLVKE